MDRSITSGPVHHNVDRSVTSGPVRHVWTGPSRLDWSITMWTGPSRLDRFWKLHVTPVNFHEQAALSLVAAAVFSAASLTRRHPSFTHRRRLGSPGQIITLIFLPALWRRGDGMRRQPVLKKKLGAAHIEVTPAFLSQCGGAVTGKCDRNKTLSGEQESEERKPHYVRSSYGEW
ncbi:hypothetical protein EYF80_047215 [Liparis tanakae]|uniref:Uncharacterized protein n=1 Tax=Liparis tanakae TaxID=230148 RepID=A0A4Z2FP83_9TELE|nr:hypothetical protein EYF80_047215 [Liparis tanakae]